MASFILSLLLWSGMKWLSTCVCLSGFFFPHMYLSLSACHCNCSLYSCRLSTPGLLPLWVSWHKPLCAAICFFFLINRFSSGVSLDWDWASGTRAWLLEHQMSRSDSLVKSFTGTHLHKQSRISLTWREKEQGSLFCIPASLTQA